MISSRDSEIKARYALAVLRVAQASDRETAARLVQGLARDLPHPEEQREMASLHFEAMEILEKLLQDLRVSAVAPSSWRAATDAVSKWLDAAEGSYETIGKSQAECSATAPVFPDQCQSSLYDTCWSEFMTESSRHRGEIDRPSDFSRGGTLPLLKTSSI